MRVRVQASIIGSALMAGSILGSGALAQTQEAIIAQCREAPDAQTRIDCLETALLGLPVEAFEPADENERRGFRLPRLPFGGNDDAETAPAQTASVAPIAGASGAATGLGADQVNARNADPREARERRQARIAAERVASTVTEFRTIPYQRLEVRLANGQVWRQLPSDSQRVVDRMRSSRAYSVDVWEGNLGGYLLRVNELSRVIRVERVQ